MSDGQLTFHHPGNQGSVPGLSAYTRQAPVVRVSWAPLPGSLKDQHADGCEVGEEGDPPTNYQVLVIFQG